MTDWFSLMSSIPEPETDADYATMRVLGRTTIGRSFELSFGSDSMKGQLARTVWQIISEDADGAPSDSEGEEYVLYESKGGRVQVKARVVKDQGRVCELRFERVTGYVNKDSKLETLVKLDEEGSRRLLDLCLALRHIDPTDGETVKFDDATMAAFLADPDAVASAYVRDPELFRAMIESDVDSQDVIALSARRRTLDEFKLLLDDAEAFEVARGGGSHERVWQDFFERNSWVLGVGLSAHLFTAWDNEKLEKTVAGASISDVGKRVDALMTTSGAIRSVVLAEIKRHDDDLLEGKEGKSYRSGTWAPSRAVVGGVAQAQVTAFRAREDISGWLESKSKDGYSTGERSFVGSPRSYLVVGRLSSLTRDGATHEDMFRSFELFRRSVVSPEIVTFDEVLARAEWALAQTSPTA